MTQNFPFEYTHLENARRVEHPFGVVYELTRTADCNVARAQITDDVKHYHRQATEIYHVISGIGRMELDRHVVDIKSGTTIEIQPGVRHRAWSNNGILDIIVFSSPPYNPNDEFHD